MKNGEIFILVYDVTNSKSFEELNYWKEEVYNLVGKECIIGIIGNKCDLYLKEEVREEQALNFAEENGFYFRVMSAKCTKDFDIFVEELLKRYIEEFLPKNYDEKIFLRKEKEEYEYVGCCNKKVKKRVKYYPFMERFKGRTFPWYRPKWEHKKEDRLPTDDFDFFIKHKS